MTVKLAIRKSCGIIKVQMCYENSTRTPSLKINSLFILHKTTHIIKKYKKSN